MKNEELKRLYLDRDEAENELEDSNERMRQLEIENDDYESILEWNEEFDYSNNLTNEISNMTSWIESIEEGYED
jgi:flagellar motility protein MotE (MotC chaperone)